MDGAADKPCKLLLFRGIMARLIFILASTRVNVQQLSMNIVHGRPLDAALTKTLNKLNNQREVDSDDC